MKSILVQMSEHSWTMRAVHLACALARNSQADVMLLRMIAVTHPGYLGTPYGNQEPTMQERKLIKEALVTAEDYQVNLTLQSIQYVTALNAVVDAVEGYDADTVFAHVPKSFIPYWQKFRIRALERKLQAQHCQLFTLEPEPNPIGQLPYIVKTPAHSSTLR